MFPAIGYSPETRFMGGVIGAYLWQDTTTRKSSVTGEFLYSQNDQVQTGFSFEAYFDSDRKRLAGEVYYFSWPNKFYGIGNQTPSTGEESFSEKYFHLSAGLFQAIAGGLSAGLEYEMRATSASRFSDSSPSMAGSIPGIEENLISGAGPALFFDTRDDNFVPTTGYQVYLSARWYGKPIGSDYVFGRYVLDARKYIPVQGGHVVGIQTYMAAVDGTAPFQMLALAGGDVRGRGYYLGRYRDNIMIAAQAEYRSPLLYRLGVALFAGFTEVSDRFGGLSSSELHPYLGFGIRFRLLNDAKVNIRFDWGFGDNSSGNYVGVNEAF
jgi:outer membrane protein assembly factor BamA